MGDALAQQIEAFFAVAGNAGDANHHAQDTRQTGDGKLLDADGHLGIGVVGIDLEGLLAIVAGGEALASGGDVAVVDQGDEGGMETASVSAGEVGVFVGGVGFDALLAEVGDGVVEGLDAVADGSGDGDVAFGGEEGVVGVVGGVEEVLVIELAEDEDHEDVAGGHGVLRVGGEDGLETGDGTLVVEDVEMLKALADDGIEVERVGVERIGLALRLQDRGKHAGQENKDGGETYEGGAAGLDASATHVFLAPGDRRLKIRLVVLEILMGLLSKYTVASVRTALLV